MVRIGVAQHHLEVLEGLSYLRVRPGRLASPQTLIALGSQRAGQHVFKDVAGFPTVLGAYHERLDASRLELVGYLLELLKGGRRGQPIVLEDGLVIPQDVGAVDVGRHTPEVPLVLEQGQQVGREGVLQSFGGIDIVQWLQVLLRAVGFDFQAGMELESVGWVAAEEASGQHGLEVGAGAAGHGGVHDLDFRVFLFVDAEHAGQALGLAAGCPPASDNQLSGSTGSVQQLRFARVVAGQECLSVGRAGNPDLPAHLDHVGVHDASVRAVFQVFLVGGGHDGRPGSDASKEAVRQLRQPVVLLDEVVLAFSGLGG